MEVIMVKKKITPEQRAKRRFWENHIESWKAGGLSQARYCRNHQLKPHRFVYWKKKLLPAQASPVSLVELSMPQPVQLPQRNQSAKLKVAIGDDFKVEVLPGFDPGTLREIISTLGQV